MRPLTSAIVSEDPLFDVSTSGDTTPPTQSNATASADGTDGYSGSVDTDEGNGTLYHVVTQSSTAPTATEVENGNDDTGSAADASGSQAISSTGTKSVGQIGVLSADTQYWVHYMHEDSAGNQSSVASSSSFTTTADAPTLSNATASATGENTAGGSVDTDTATGTLYAVIQQASIADPTATQIKNGNAGDGTAAADSGSQTISSTGSKSFSFSGLTAGTNYEVFFVQEDGSGTDSNVTSSGTIMTDEETIGLTNASANSTGENTGEAHVDTDEGNGTLYLVVQEDGVSAPSRTQMRNGNAGDGTPAAAGDSQTISSTGTKSFTFSGLTSGTTYRAYFYQET